MLALGIDVGNAKVKVCVQRRGERPRWTSRNLPYDARRPYARQDDFARGVPAAIDAMIAREEVAAVVAVTSAGYSYPTFHEGVRHLAEILDATFPGADVRFLSFSGGTVPSSRLGLDVESGPAAFTNPLGAVILAQRLPAFGGSGLVLDTGGTTTGIVPVDGDRVDPEAMVDPARHVLHRMTRGKQIWIGAQTTPLEAIADEVTTKLGRLAVIPRGVAFDNVSVLLDLLPAERAKKLSLFGLLPKRADALRAIADAIGLDTALVEEETLLEVARVLHARAVARLAHAIRGVANGDTAIAFGLGARGLAQPALLAAGVQRVLMADEHIAKDLAEVASCYGACHAALEMMEGRRLELSPE